MAGDAAPRPAERQVPEGMVLPSSVFAGEIVPWNPRQYPPLVQQHAQQQHAANLQAMQQTRQRRTLRWGWGEGGEPPAGVQRDGGAEEGGGSGEREGGVEREVSEETVSPGAGFRPAWSPWLEGSEWVVGESAREAEGAAPRPLSQAQLSQRHTQMLGRVGLVPVQSDGGAEEGGGSGEREEGVERQVSEETAPPSEAPWDEGDVFPLESDREEGGDGDGESTASEEDS